MFCCCCICKFAAFFLCNRPCNSIILWSTERNSAWRCCNASRCNWSRASCCSESWFRYYKFQIVQNVSMKNLHSPCIHKKFITMSSLRSFSSSLAAGDVACWLLPLFVIKFKPRLSLLNSSNCLVNASTFATAKLSSFSFSLNKARIESRSLPVKRGKEEKVKIVLNVEKGFDKYQKDVANIF